MSCLRNIRLIAHDSTELIVNMKTSAELRTMTPNALQFQKKFRSKIPVRCKIKFNHPPSETSLPRSVSPGLLNLSRKKLQSLEVSQQPVIVSPNISSAPSILTHSNLLIHPSKTPKVFFPNQKQSNVPLSSVPLFVSPQRGICEYESIKSTTYTEINDQLPDNSQVPRIKSATSQPSTDVLTNWLGLLTGDVINRIQPRKRNNSTIMTMAERVDKPLVNHVDSVEAVSQIEHGQSSASELTITHNAQSPLLVAQVMPEGDINNDVTSYCQPRRIVSTKTPEKEIILASDNQNQINDLQSLLRSEREIEVTHCNPMMETKSCLVFNQDEYSEEQDDVLGEACFENPLKYFQFQLMPKEQSTMEIRDGEESLDDGEERWQIFWKRSSISGERSSISLNACSSELEAVIVSPSASEQCLISEATNSVTLSRSQQFRKLPRPLIRAVAEERLNLVDDNLGQAKSAATVWRESNDIVTYVCEQSDSAMTCDAEKASERIPSTLGSFTIESSTSSCGQAADNWDRSDDLGDAFQQRCNLEKMKRRVLELELELTGEKNKYRELISWTKYVEKQLKVQLCAQSQYEIRCKKLLEMVKNIDTFTKHVIKMQNNEESIRYETCAGIVGNESEHVFKGNQQDKVLRIRELSKDNLAALDPLRSNATLPCDRTIAAFFPPSSKSESDLIRRPGTSCSEINIDYCGQKGREMVAKLSSDSIGKRNFRKAKRPTFQSAYLKHKRSLILCEEGTMMHCAAKISNKYQHCCSTSHISDCPPGVNSTGNSLAKVETMDCEIRGAADEEQSMRAVQEKHAAEKARIQHNPFKKMSENFPNMKMCRSQDDSLWSQRSCSQYCVPITRAVPFTGCNYKFDLPTGNGHWSFPEVGVVHVLNIQKEFRRSALNLQHVHFDHQLDKTGRRDKKKLAFPSSPLSLMLMTQNVHSRGDIINSTLLPRRVSKKLKVNLETDAYRPSKKKYTVNVTSCDVGGTNLPIEKTEEIDVRCEDKVHRVLAAMCDYWDETRHLREPEGHHQQ